MSNENELTRKIHHTEVARGHWTTAYHLYPYLPFSKFPPEYRAVFDVATTPINALQGWEPEGFISFTNPTSPLVFFSVAMHTDSSKTPMTSRLHGPQGLVLRRVFYQEPIKEGWIKLRQIKDTVFDYGSVYHISFPTARPDISKLLTLERPPIVNRLIVSHFHYLQNGSGKLKAVADDPWRFQLTVVGIPDELLKQAEEGILEMRRNKVAGAKNAQAMDLVLTSAYLAGRLYVTQPVPPEKSIYLYDPTKKDWVAKPITASSTASDISKGLLSLIKDLLKRF